MTCATLRLSTSPKRIAGTWKIQDKYGVKYMTYWYDEARGTGFCLVEAPDAATAAHVHREAHGEIPSDIIPVDLAAVEAFLGRIGDPRLAAGAAMPDWMLDCAACW
jgi:Protein of unknown function (DUF4242)